MEEAGRKNSAMRRCGAIDAGHRAINPYRSSLKMAAEWANPNGSKTHRIQQTTVDTVFEKYNQSD
jgi:hypothetical protein